LGFLGDYATISLVLFIIGLVLMIIELFTPGFGVAGILGVAAFAAVIVLQFMGNTPMAAWIVTAVILLITVGLLAFLIHSFQSGRLSKSKLILHDTIEASSSPIVEEISHVQVGEVGTTLTPLRPTGLVQFGARRVNVSSFGNFISAGRQVEVASAENMNIWVRERDCGSSPQ